MEIDSFSRYETIPPCDSERRLEIIESKENSDPCPAFCYSEKCPRRSGVLFGSIFAIGLVTFIFFCLTSVGPYMGVIYFQPAKCKGVAYRLIGQRKCSCTGKQEICMSYYPCAEVFVKIEDNNRSPVPIYKDERDLFKSKCSYHFLTNCDTNQDYNSARVWNFVNSYGTTNATFVCYYNPQKADKAIVQFYEEFSAVVQMIFWPGLAIVIGMSGFIVTVILKGWKTVLPSRHQCFRCCGGYCPCL